MSVHLIDEEWHGDELIARSHRANARAILGMGESVSAEMKGVAHVGGPPDQHPGMLKADIHVAVKDTMGEIHADNENIRTGGAEWQIEVGSWVPYACVENNRGGQHRFADIGWELASPFFHEKLERAWEDEGL